MSTADALTRQWVRNRSDELAIEAGYRFDGEQGAFVCDWIEKYCRLYEGEFAGQPLILQHWQRELVMRLFGWVKDSEKWGRAVRRFRRGSLWVPKKNGKSPTLAAIGLYLLCGDGEQGQKVYSVAKDGKQAMISHTHAIEMVRMSPELSDECTINKTTGQITHEPSRSFYRIVAGDNPNSQEGLNGSVMVDETHVVDSRLMRILRGAGISRSEPLQLEVSTAGKNPDGYGKQQYDFGQQVANGGIVDHRFFFQAYCAPQDVSDSDLDSRLLEIGQAANPSWGVTIDPEEFQSEYKASRRSLTDLGDFKMYRLDVWQASSNPWIRQGDWDACGDDFTEQDLEGYECWCGLDLSRTRDMTAASLVFPWDDEYRILTYFWLPHEQAQNHQHEVPFFEWQRDGHLNLTDGNVIDYSQIEKTLLSLAERFRIRQWVYDPVFAEELTQRLQDQSGVPRIEMRQTGVVVGPAADDFDKLVSEHKLRHNRHPVMTWQVRHCEVRRDPITKLTRPIKPNGNASGVRKIDGVMATIFGIKQAFRPQAAVGISIW